MTGETVYIYDTVNSKIIMKYIIYAGITLMMFMAVEVTVLSLVTFSLPNQISFELINNLEIYSQLFHANPIIAFKVLLINNPVFIIQKVNDLGDTQLWGVYIMPITVITWLAASVFFVQIKKVSPPLNIIWWIAGASVLLIMSVFYLRIQACCTESPAWFLDVMILSRVFNPLVNSGFWQDVYLNVSPWFKTMQLFFLAAAMVLFYFSYTMSRNNK